MAYCRVSDIDLGSLELPRGFSTQTAVDRASDDIDAVVGRFYRLPLRWSETDPRHKPYVLLLKKLNIYLATGDLIFRAAGARQDDSLNSYALWYLNRAKDMLKQIEQGKITFPDQAEIEAPEGEFNGPILVNKDSRSRVEAFYSSAPGEIAPQHLDYRPSAGVPWPR